MRLSNLLAKAPENAEGQVEPFLGGVDEESGEPIELFPGYHQMVGVGSVLINFFCRLCDAQRTFASGNELSCLVVDDRMVSIDAYLRCPGCDIGVETWFLVTFRDDLGIHAPTPTVRLERYVDNRRNEVGRVSAQTGAGDFDDLLERAQLAHEHQLGLGSMVYLRIIFETLTKQVARVTGISLNRDGGYRKSFRALLKEVDEEHCIIPRAFSSNGYKLYSELSEVVHGNSTEVNALEKYLPCESLVRGIIDNVASDQEMKQAIKDLGWTEEGMP